MRTSKVVLSFILLSAVIFFTGQSAMGGCAIKPDGSPPIDTDKTAPGTKLSGPLTVFLDESSNPNKIYFFLRLRKGYDLYCFAGSYDPDVTNGDKEPNINNFVTLAEEKVTEFFEDTVIPEIYEEECAADNCPPVSLKSYDQDVNSGDQGETNDLELYVMDIVVAVED